MSLAQICRWHIYQDPRDFLERSASVIMRIAEQTIRERGVFKIVLAGGTTPLAIYEVLCSVAMDWTAWHVYFGDERCLPADHTSRNSIMVSNAFLAHVNIPKLQVYPIPAELGPEAGARVYSKTLAHVDFFDLVVLGLGEDGHTASLFPCHEWGLTATSSPALAVHGAPGPFAERVSLSAWRLSKSRQTLLFVAGEAKASAVAAWYRKENIPALFITPPSGVDVLTEISACKNLLSTV